jgi:UDPglucose--hexose-1-phosphate uridylyltransferase
MSERRRDPLTGSYVILAPKRRERPNSHDGGSSPGECPFCPGREEETPPSVLEFSLAGESSWYVRAFPNLFPIVGPDQLDSGGTPVAFGDAVSGRHEVVVETPLHDHEMSLRTPEELVLALMAFRARLRVLLAMPDIRHVVVFKNRGPAAGESLDHPHSQIVALSYVPPFVSRTVASWRGHFRRAGCCLLCQQLSRERDAGLRLIREQDGFSLSSPSGAARPGEMVLAPLHHQAGFAATTDDALAGLSRALLSALRRMRTAFDNPPYNLVLQTWPRSRQEDEALHWYLSIVPRLGTLGGFELATGEYVSTVSPEEAAALYRAAESA